jgi:hypothetical protein
MRVVKTRNAIVGAMSLGDQFSSLRLLLSRNVNPAASKIASRIVSEGGLEP